jgi:hypothetical protein
MGSNFKCPHCDASLRKTPTDILAGRARSFIISASETEKCPACGGSINRLNIINGKYDEKEWWQFWK